VPARKKPSRLTSYFFLLINVICWGAALIVVKPAFDVTTPFRFLFYRYGLAVLFSLPLLFHYLPSIKKLKQTLITITLLELFGTTFALSLLYFGLDRTSAIEASLIATTLPIFISVFGVWLLKEKQEKHEIVGLITALAGTLLLTIFPLMYGIMQSTVGKVSIQGNLLIVAQNTAIALYYILAKKKYAKLPKLFVTTISFYVGLVSFFILSLFEAGSMGSLQQLIITDWQFPSVWIASGYMALFGSIIGLTAYIKGQDGIEASEASLFTYLDPLVYIPLGILLLGERVFPLQIISVLIILTGVVLAERRRS
jgi:drug/metabolite transporter (DMT)-like permease